MTEIVIIVSVIVGVAALLAHTGALFYWGGKVTAKLTEHDRRLNSHESILGRLMRSVDRTSV